MDYKLAHSEHAIPPPTVVLSEILLKNPFKAPLTQTLPVINAKASARGRERQHEQCLQVTRFQRQSQAAKSYQSSPRREMGILKLPQLIRQD